MDAKEPQYSTDAGSISPVRMTGVELRGAQNG